MTWTFWGLLLIVIGFLAHGAYRDAKTKERDDARAEHDREVW